MACASAALVLLATAVPAVSQAQVPDNDNFISAVPLVYGQVDDRYDNVGATIESGEGLTPATAELGYCGYDDGTSSQANFTTWWSLIGTGRPVKVSTDGSAFDSHLGIFSNSINDPLYCYDDGPNEDITFDTEPGQRYQVQVGGCWDGDGATRGCGTPTEGAISVEATSDAADNDDRAHAQPLTTGTLATGDNYAATEEAGEPTSCAAAPYGRTVWYRWTAPSAGGATFTSTNFDTVLTVLPAAGGAPLGCNDDNDPEHPGGSSVQVVVSAGTTYLVQVAGYGSHDGFEDSKQGQFSLQTAFTVDPDFDHDGAANASDCQPFNAAVHPGAVDVPANGLDEDCSGADAIPPVDPDRDHDGAINGQDCAPDNAAVHPGATDTPQNGIDENCDGRDASYPRLTSEARVSSTRHPKYWTISSVKVKQVPAGAVVELRCSGKGCPFRRHALPASRFAGTKDLTTRAIKRAHIGKGAVFEIRVTLARTIGVVRRYVFARLRQRATTQDLCLKPGATAPTTRC